MRPLILHPEEKLALDRGADLLLILDRPGIVSPMAGEQLFGYVGTPDNAAPIKVLSARLTTIGDLTDAEKRAAVGSEEKFIPWLMRMMGPVLWSTETKVYATTVKAVAS